MKPILIPGLLIRLIRFLLRLFCVPLLKGGLSLSVRSKCLELIKRHQGIDGFVLVFGEEQTGFHSFQAIGPVNQAMGSRSCTAPEKSDGTATDNTTFGNIRLFQVGRIQQRNRFNL